MSKIIKAVLALAIAALASSAFATGTGMPMMKGLKDPTELASLVDSALQRDPTGKTLLDAARCKKSGSCASAYNYFYGIQKRHPNAKLEDIAELPRYLRSLVEQPAPAGVWQISRLLVHGSTYTYDPTGWHRAFLQGEKVWSDVNTGEPTLAGNCGNVIGDGPTNPAKTPPKPVPVATPADAPAPIASCPDKYVIVTYVWDNRALKLPGVEQTAAREAMLEQFSGAVHVSRTHGKQLRDAYAEGKIGQSETARVYQMSLIMTPEATGGSSEITEELVLGNVTMKGHHKQSFTRAQIDKWDAVRLAPLADDFSSPPPYVVTGLNELRFFFHLPGTKLGDWDGNYSKNCLMYRHLIEEGN